MAQFDNIIGPIVPPEVLRQFSNGSAGIQAYLTVLVRAFYAISVVVFLFMILYAGYQWMVSGGNKESIMNARGRITNAVIGLAVISLAFFITKVVTTILGIPI